MHRFALNVHRVLNEFQWAVFELRGAGNPRMLAPAMRCTPCLFAMAAGLLAAGPSVSADTNKVRYMDVPSHFAYSAPVYNAPHLRTRASIPPGTPNPSADEVARLVAEADRLAGQKDWDQAAALINQCLEEFPDDADLLSRAGHYYMMKRSYAVSESYWSRLAALYPDSAWAQACWGGTLLRLGQNDKAKTALDRALKLNPREIVARFHMACLLLAEGAAESARLTLGSLNLLEIGNCATWIRDEPEPLVQMMGIDRLRQLCDLVLAGGEAPSPDGADTRSMDALALRDLMNRVAQDLWTGYQAMQKKDWAAAEDTLASASADGIAAPVVKQGIAYCRVMRGDPAKAFTVMAELAGRYTNSPFVQFKFGLLCMDQARYKTAAVALLSAHRSAPDDQEVTVTLAGACAALSLADDAWRLLSSIPPASRSSWLAWFNQPRPYAQALRQDARFSAWAVATAPPPLAPPEKLQD